MPRTGPAQWPGLLEPAIGYALAAVQAVTPELLPEGRPFLDLGRALQEVVEAWR